MRPETKPAFRTTEFWLTMGTNVGNIALMIADLVPPRYGAVALIIGNGLYALARGLAKQGIDPNPTDSQVGR